VDTNINAAFVIVFTGFLYIEEIIYPNRKIKDFSTTNALYSNIRITFSVYVNTGNPWHDFPRFPAPK
jgi:hypothetical protein